MKHLVKQEDPKAFKEEEEMASLSKKEKESRFVSFFKMFHPWLKMEKK